MLELKAGEYTKAELQKILGASSKTVDRYRKRFGLPDKIGPGQAIRIVVNDQAAEFIREFVSSRVGQDQDNDCNDMDSEKSGVQDVSIVRALEAKIYEIEKEKIRLEGDLKERNTLLLAKDDILSSKKNEIETLKISLSAMEKTAQSLQASMILLERDNQRMSEKLTPSIPMIMASQKPKTFWERLRFIFSE